MTRYQVSLPGLLSGGGETTGGSSGEAPFITRPELPATAALGTHCLLPETDVTAASIWRMEQTGWVRVMSGTVPSTAGGTGGGGTGGGGTGGGGTGGGGTVIIETGALIAYVAPVASGDGKGDTPANAAGGWPSIPGLVAAGKRDIRLLSDRGTYNITNYFYLTTGGTSATAPLRIRGVGSDGASPAQATIKGNRPRPWKYGNAHGPDAVRLRAGVNNVEFSYLTFADVQNAIWATGPLSNLRVDNCHGVNVRRFVENVPVAPLNHPAGAAVPPATVAGLTISNWTVRGFSKSAVRLRNDTHTVLIENFLADSEKQDGDDFAMGLFFEGTNHNMTIRRGTVANCKDIVLNDPAIYPSLGRTAAKRTYWNGDGVVFEEDCYDCLVEDVDSYGHTDRGADCKSKRVVFRRFRAWGSKRGIGLHVPANALPDIPTWGRDNHFRVEDSTLFDPVKDGLGISSGPPACMWVESYAIVDAVNLICSDTKNGYELFNLEGNSTLNVTGGTFQTMSGKPERVNAGSPVTYNVTGVTRITNAAAGTPPPGGIIVDPGGNTGGGTNTGGGGNTPPVDNTDLDTPPTPATNPVVNPGSTPVAVTRNLGVHERIAVNATNAARVRLVVGDDEAVTVNLQRSVEAVPDSYGDTVVPFRVMGLPAGSTRWARFEMLGADGTWRRDTFPDPVRIITPPAAGTPHSFTIVMGGCHKDAEMTGANLMASFRDPYWWRMGDPWYADLSGQNEANYRARNLACDRRPAYVILGGTAHCIDGPSDHEWGMANNLYGAVAPVARDLYLSTYRVKHGNKPPRAGDVGTDHVVGRVQLLNLDLRSQMTDHTAADGPGKTKMGPAQKARVQELFNTSPYKLWIVYVEMDWLQPTTAGEDDWGGYDHERQWLISEAARTGRVLQLVMADTHLSGYDAGKAGFGGAAVKSFMAAPIGNVTSKRNLTWDQQLPAADGVLSFFCGRVTVTDTGTDTITVRCRAYNAKSATPTTPVIDESYGVTGVGAFVAPPADGGGGGGTPPPPPPAPFEPRTSSQNNSSAPVVSADGLRLEYLSGNSQWARFDFAQDANGAIRAEVTNTVKWLALDTTTSRWAGLHFGGPATGQVFHDGNSAGVAPTNVLVGVAGYRGGLRQNGGMLFGEVAADGSTVTPIGTELPAGTLPAVTIGMVETVKFGRYLTGDKTGRVYLTRIRADGSSSTIESPAAETTWNGPSLTFGKFGSDGINVAWGVPVVT